jgi:hypothetical protein
LRLDQAPDKGSGVSLASCVFARDGIERTAPVHCIATDLRLAGYGSASQTGGRACHRGRPTVDRASADRGSFGVRSSWIGEYCDAVSIAIVPREVSVGDPMKRRSANGNSRSGGLPLVDRFDERDLYTGLRSMVVRDRCANSGQSPAVWRTDLTEP